MKPGDMVRNIGCAVLMTVEKVRDELVWCVGHGGPFVAGTLIIVLTAEQLAGHARPHLPGEASAVPISGAQGTTSASMGNAADPAYMNFTGFNGRLPGSGRHG